MKKFFPIVLLAGVSAVSAFAQEDETGGAYQPAPVSQATGVNMNQGNLRDESVGLKPQVGALMFHDATGNQTSRGGIGLALDFNFSKWAAPATSVASQNIYFGLSTGGLYSHLGNPGSGFFGSNSSGTVVTNGGGANFFLFPINAKLGYNVSDNLRISGHGGGNVIYNSSPASMNFGNTGMNWQILPNVGGDVDIGLGRSVAVTLRPDWTFTGGVGFFTGTLEFGFALG